MYNLGIYYYDKDKIENDENDENYKKAVELFNKAIILNDTRALYAISFCYELGKGVEKDELRAFEYLMEYYQKTQDKRAHERICNIIKNDLNNDFKFLFKLYAYKQENEELKKENEHLKYCPSIGYEQAKNDFYLLNG